MIGFILDDCHVIVSGPYEALVAKAYRGYGVDAIDSPTTEMKIGSTTIALSFAGDCAPPAIDNLISAIEKIESHNPAKDEIILLKFPKGLRYNKSTVDFVTVVTRHADRLGLATNIKYHSTSKSHRILSAQPTKKSCNMSADEIASILVKDMACAKNCKYRQMRTVPDSERYMYYIKKNSRRTMEDFTPGEMLELSRLLAGYIYKGGAFPYTCMLFASVCVDDRHEIIDTTIPRGVPISVVNGAISRFVTEIKDRRGM